MSVADRGPNGDGFPGCIQAGVAAGVSGGIRDLCLSGCGVCCLWGERVVSHCGCCASEPVCVDGSVTCQADR